MPNYLIIAVHERFAKISGDFRNVETFFLSKKKRSRGTDPLWPNSILYVSLTKIVFNHPNKTRACLVFCLPHIFEIFKNCHPF